MASCYCWKYGLSIGCLKCVQFHNRPFPSSPGPLFQNEGRCSAFDMEIIFYSHANITYFHKKGCAPSLTLTVRVFGTRKCPMVGASVNPLLVVNNFGGKAHS